MIFRIVHHPVYYVADSQKGVKNVDILAEQDKQIPDWIKFQRKKETKLIYEKITWIKFGVPETKYKSFKECSHCNGKAGYCSSKCRKEHISYHRKFECTSKISSTSATVTASSSSNNYENYSKQNSNKIYDYLPNSFANRRNSENLFHNNQDIDIYGTISSGYSRTSKRLSKYVFKLTLTFRLTKSSF